MLEQRWTADRSQSLESVRWSNPHTGPVVGSTSHSGGWRLAGGWSEQSPHWMVSHLVSLVVRMVSQGQHREPFGLFSGPWKSCVAT